MKRQGLWLDYETRRGAVGSRRLPLNPDKALKTLRSGAYIFAELYLDDEKIGGRQWDDTAQGYNYWLDPAPLNQGRAAPCTEPVGQQR